MTILTATEELVDNILGSVQVGEFAVVHPLGMEHCCILGYLLAWKLLLVFFNAAPSQVRHLSHSVAQIIFFFQSLECFILFWFSCLLFKHF